MKKIFCDICDRPITSPNQKFTGMIDSINILNPIDAPNNQEVEFVEIEIILKNAKKYDICKDCVFDQIKKNDSRNNTNFDKGDYNE